MKVLVINSGSSSIKCTLFQMPEQRALARCDLDRIGEDESTIAFSSDDRDFQHECDADDHGEGLDTVLDAFSQCGDSVLGGLDEIGAVGHRVVHGGEEIAQSTKVDREVIRIIRENFELAPLHNPPNMRGLEAALYRLPDTPQVAVFDTAFHRSIPPRAFLYALPYELYENHRLRRYGFHGTSHEYVAQRAAEMLERPFEECNLITLHLGNGCSATAVKEGKSVDTSMGLTPLEGLVMGTRSGDGDPALPYFLTTRLDMESEEVYELLNRKSGLLGLSGVSNDMREILQESENGSERATRALEVFCYRLKKYIGAYTAVLGDVDGIVFTAGIGENCPEVRSLACGELEGLGIEVDENRNAEVHGEEAIISKDSSPTALLVIPTNEELKIAIDTYELCRDENE